MSVDGVGGSSPLQAMQSLVGVGIRALNMANQSQADMAAPLLAAQSGQSPARSSVEAKGMMVDVYA
ncbi:MAG: hypothetical protein LBT97_07380 [Planctomycetota bacterium]|jgi:hypothetical protein|nr:hypothetical protein [Planctomycetota bacterium]